MCEHTSIKHNVKVKAILVIYRSVNVYYTFFEFLSTFFQISLGKRV
jgi:hypothetical protein